MVTIGNRIARGFYSADAGRLARRILREFVTEWYVTGHQANERDRRDSGQLPPAGMLC